MVKKTKWKSPPARAWHRWKHNIREDFKETGCEVVNWIKYTIN
jgi:hypothetical protein